MKQCDISISDALWSLPGLFEWAFPIIVYVLGAMAFVVEFLIPLIAFGFAIQQAVDGCLESMFFLIVAGSICVVILYRFLRYFSKKMRIGKLCRVVLLLNLICFACCIGLGGGFFIKVFIIHIISELIMVFVGIYNERDAMQMNSVYRASPVYQAPHLSKKTSALYFEEPVMHKSSETEAIKKEMDEIKSLLLSLENLKLGKSENVFTWDLRIKSCNIEVQLYEEEVSGLSKKELALSVKNKSFSRNKPSEKFLREFTYQTHLLSGGVFTMEHVNELVAKRDACADFSVEEKSMVNFYKAAECMFEWSCEDYSLFDWQDIMEKCVEILNKGSSDRSVEDIKKSYTPVVFEFPNKLKCYLDNDFLWTALIFGRLMSESADDKYDMRKVVLLLNILLCFKHYSPVIIKSKEKQEFFDAVSKVKDSDYAPLMQFLFHKEFD